MKKDVSPEATGEAVQVGRFHFSPYTYAWILTSIGLVGYLFTTFDVAIFGASLPSIAATFHMTSSMISYLVAGVFAFGAVSGFILGPVADRVGRKPTFQIILTATGIFSGVTAFVANVASLTAVRTLSGVGINATSPVNTLIAEETPIHRRGMLMGVMQAGFPLGSAIAGTMAAIFLPDWRPLFLIAFAPVLMALAASVFLRESPQFKKAFDERKHGLATSQEGIHSHVQAARRSIVSQMLDRDVRRQSIVVTVFNFLAPAGVIMVATFVTLYATDVQHFSVGMAALLLAINNGVALVAQVSIGILSDYIAPKWIQVVGALVAALTPIVSHPRQSQWGVLRASGRGYHVCHLASSRGLVFCPSQPPRLAMGCCRSTSSSRSGNVVWSRYPSWSYP